MVTLCRSRCMSSSFQLSREMEGGVSVVASAHVAAGCGFAPVWIALFMLIHDGTVGALGSGIRPRRGAVRQKTRLTAQEER